MRKSIHLKRPFQSGAIQIDALPLGRDWQIMLYGGAAHIGAVALAVCYDTNRRAVNVSQMAVYGHREDALCREVASTLSKTLKTTVVVSAGIHFDGLSEQDIKKIRQIALALTEKLIETILKT